MDPIDIGAVWLHLLATVFMLGYYVLLAVVLVPVMRRILDPAPLADLIQAVERRALPLVLGSVAVFVLTGAYLMLNDSHYGGLGDFFGTSWAVIIVAKHVLVLAMIAVGVVIDVLFVPDIATPSSEEAQLIAIRRLTVAVDLMAVLAAVVLLLTAAAQLS